MIRSDRGRVYLQPTFQKAYEFFLYANISAIGVWLGLYKFILHETYIPTNSWVDLLSSFHYILSIGPSCFLSPPSFFFILFNVSVFVIKDIFLKNFLQLFPAVFRPYYSFVLRATEVDNASVTKCNIRPFVSTMFCGP